MLSAKEIRESYKKFFEGKGHQIVPSAPMVIKDDPTLMFTNAGMNQFKDIILGNSPIKYSRVADSQKCLRVSGKHNDLEEVGIDTYHHTMFEMLGNWSFGDYFKKEAIEWAWEYLVDVLKLDPTRLYATVFEGYAPEGLERDNEAAAIWEKFLPAERIINGNRKDNFWEMGDMGPCGPCSELHIDLRSEEERAAVDGLTLVNESHPQVVEIWNLVFMQYNRKADGSLEPLPARVIDTGMGFERLAMAVQGKTSNYDTDVFQPIIQTMAKMSNVSYGVNEQTDIALRVIADHVRTIAFSITDGQLPSNAKAGYVIRRILRRAVRYGYTFLGQTSSFMHKLLPSLIDTMGDAYGELVQQKGLIEKVIKEEEESFLRTLETGIRLLEGVMNSTKAEGKTEVSGVTAFTLYDTYGFPLDLTELILKENNMSCNIEEFDAQMKMQKDRARNAAAIETGDWIILKEGDQLFVGYDLMECDTEILRYRQIKQKNQTLYQLVLEKTPFYAESGGQVGDTGTLSNDEESLVISTVKRENNLGVHYTSKLPKDPTATFRATIDVDKREATAANHTATHLIHEALREILGSHVEQKGSLVTPEMLRFDFSHFQKVTDEEIAMVEKIVNRRIRQNIALDEFRNLPINEAKEMGAMALFGEKYGDDVRVIRYGSSVELCGGTHASSTGALGMIKIIAESSTAAGIRRIEAISGEKVEEYFTLQSNLLRDLRSMFNNAPNITQAIRKTIEESQEMKKVVEEMMKEKAVQIKKGLVQMAVEINGVKVIRLEGNFPADMVKNIAFELRGEIAEKFIFAAATSDNNKPMLTVMMSDALVADGLNAGAIVREAAKLIQGGGGGQAHFAQAGGKNAEGTSAALTKMLELAGC
ncbi:MAG: alanine--tRNA ligase [Bacteroidales bacterium]